MLKDYKNKQITQKDEKTKKVKKSSSIYSFKGNPPVSIEASSQEEANEKFIKLQDKK